jgi:fibronectin type 3 domain-containing protein
VVVAELTATATGYSDMSVSAGRTYRYKLTALDAARNASPPAKVRLTL